MATLETGIEFFQVLWILKTFRSFHIERFLNTFSMQYSFYKGNVKHATESMVAQSV